MAGNIKGIVIEFRGETTKLDSALKQVNKETRSIDQELRKVNNALKFNPTSVDLWRQKQTLLTQKVNETKTKLDALKEAKAKLDDDPAVDKTTADYRELEREIVTTESKLKTFQAQLRKIGNAKLKALSEQFKQVGQKMMSAGRTLSTYVTAPIVAAGTVGVKKFAEVDKIMQLTNKTMGNGKAQAGLLNQAMKKAAANSTYSMKDAAQATLNFARAGLGAKDAANALAPAMALAAGEGGELDTVSSGLVATINGFHDSFKNAGKYADVFANACNNSALDVNSLSQAMSVAAPIFSAAGYTVNDAALYMGIMANNGIKANVAANSLKTGLARLISPSKEGAAWMDKLGISVTNSDGTMKDSVQVQNELHDAFSNLSESEKIAAASAIFGKNQMAPWLALINTSPKDVDKLSLSLTKNGTATQMQSSQMSGFGGSIERLKSSLDVLSTSFGEALAPTIEKVVKAVQRLTDWFNQLTPKQQSMIATLALVAAAIGPVLIVIGALATGIGAVVGAVGALGGAFAILLGPVGVVIGIIAALVAAAVLLKNNWTKIEKATKKLGVTIKRIFTQIKTTIINTWNQVKAKAIAIVMAIVTKVISVFTALRAKVKSIWTAIRTTITNVWTGIKTKVSNAVNAVKTKVVNGFNGIKDKVKSIWNTVKESITKPIEKARSVVQSAINKIKSIINGAKLSLPHFKLPHFKINGGKLPWGIGGKGKKPSISVDWYAKGGIFEDPAIIGIGEKGSEAVVPLDKLWGKLDKIAENATGTPIVINVYPSAGTDPKAIAMEVKRQLIQETNRRRLAWQ